MTVEAILEYLQVQGEYLLRILIACICGGIIGIERTLRQKYAGFRTHVIVALGASLMMIISKYGFLDVAMYDNLRADASRVASNILTGISFLGAGMIVMKGGNVRGLTTAAGIWATAAVGMAIGAGMYIIGILTTLIIVVIQIVFHTFLIGYDKVLANDNTQELIVKMSNSPESVERLKEQLKILEIEIETSRIEINDDVLTIILTVHSHEHLDFNTSTSLLMSDPEIKSVSL